MRELNKPGQSAPGGDLGFLRGWLGHRAVGGVRESAHEAARGRMGEVACTELVFCRSEWMSSGEPAGGVRRACTLMSGW